MTTENETEQEANQEDIPVDEVKPVEESTKKRITQTIKERIIHLKNNGLNTKAIASTVDFSEAAVTAAIKIGKG